METSLQPSEILMDLLLLEMSCSLTPEEPSNDYNLQKCNCFQKKKS